MIDTRIRIITIAGALILLVLVLELVRRRKLKEEYSVLWIATALVVFLLSVWYGLLTSVTDLLGLSAPASTIFFFGLIFFLLLLLHFSVRVSTLERRLTALIEDLGVNEASELEPAQQDVAPVVRSERPERP